MTDQTQAAPAAARPVYARMAVVGGGLIGSSVIRAARSHGAAGEITVADANPQHRTRLEALGIADAVFADPAEAVRGADLIVLAVPVMAMGAATAAAAAGMQSGATLTDVGSVKGAVGEAMAAAAPEGVFVIPGHPVAGTEQSGPDAGFAALFENRWNILTPLPRDDAPYQAAVERLTEFWMRLGARVELMDAAHHDLVLAVTSHLPHLIAYNIVGTAADLEEVTQGEVMKYSAGGFRDFTRIAASDPTMWRDVFLHNKDAVLDMLGRFNADLKSLQGMIEQGDGQGLFDLFTRTRAIRKGIVEQGQDTAAPDFGRPHDGKAP
jgi:cyclohexadieny/prephenate dehydrogenase